MAIAEKASTIKHALSRKPPNIRDCFQLIDQVLERVFVIGRLDRIPPGTMEFLKHLLGRGMAGVDNPVQRLEMTGLVTAEMIDVPAPPQPRMRQHQAFLGDFEQIAVPDSGLETEARHVIA